MRPTQLFTLITISLYSCQQPLEPFIGTDKDYAGVGESIRFSNINDWWSSQYIWDFGDGAVSVSERPTHAYAEEGLTFYGKAETMRLNLDFGFKVDN